MTTLETGREAAAYLQKFVRAHTKEWAELMQGVNPNQGYGRTDLAFQAWDIAMMLSNYTDEHFKTDSSWTTTPRLNISGSGC